MRCVALRSINMTCGATPAAIAEAKIAKAEYMNTKCGTDAFARERTAARTKLLNCVIDREQACVKTILETESADVVDLDKRARKAAGTVLDEVASHSGMVVSMLTFVVFFKMLF